MPVGLPLPWWLFFPYTNFFLLLSSLLLSVIGMQTRDLDQILKMTAVHNMMPLGINNNSIAPIPVQFTKKYTLRPSTKTMQATSSNMTSNLQSTSGDIEDQSLCSYHSSAVFADSVHSDANTNHVLVGLPLPWWKFSPYANFFLLLSSPWLSVIEAWEQKRDLDHTILKMAAVYDMTPLGINNNNSISPICVFLTKKYNLRPSRSSNASSVLSRPKKNLRLFCSTGRSSSCPPSRLGPQCGPRMSKTTTPLWRHEKGCSKSPNDHSRRWSLHCPCHWKLLWLMGQRDRGEGCQWAQQQ